ncbi:hypothetical protein IT072_04850 [Leifsonia sp. ZF2019]|uniref:hypothetical protein n=1 Tax=Leifsonia sp. ZF2019 TaxID=2781978 RepID=UPI001CBAB7D0|nr:hypothetical protein [Leifsonia sp. ZF2019]UAJ80369.1 hypothetical protein IT072_04850 [Leifsonia sp. ZF2019]
MTAAAGREGGARAPHLPLGRRLLIGRHGLLIALAHELPPAAAMVWACAAGSAAALCGAAIALAVLSCVYARAARTSAWAREHVVDLWAMLLAMVGAAFAATTSVPAPGSGASVTHHHLGGSLATEALAGALIAGAVCGWLVARILLARRVVRPHTLVSAVACGGMLAVMAVM